MCFYNLSYRNQVSLFSLNYLSLLVVMCSFEFEDIISKTCFKKKRRFCASFPLRKMLTNTSSKTRHEGKKRKKVKEIDFFNIFVPCYRPWHAFALTVCNLPAFLYLRFTWSREENSTIFGACWDRSSCSHCWSSYHCSIVSAFHSQSIRAFLNSFVYFSIYLCISQPIRAFLNTSVYF